MWNLSIANRRSADTCPGCYLEDPRVWQMRLAMTASAVAYTFVILVIIKPNKFSGKNW